MTLGMKIAACRKEMGLTQDALAQRLSVSNQAISKWESDQCCPDTMLLPKLADIFEITLDELFGRAASRKEQAAVPDDGVLRVVLLCGNERVEQHEVCERVEIRWNGPVRDLCCDCSVICDQVQGDVQAGGTVTCDQVQGNVNAGGSVTCDEVQGNVRAGGNVTCDDVQGSVHAGGNVTCDLIEGCVTAGREVKQN